MLVFEAMTDEILELVLEAAGEPVVVARVAPAEDGAAEVLDPPPALAMEDTSRVTPADAQIIAAAWRVSVRNASVDQLIGRPCR